MIKMFNIFGTFKKNSEVNLMAKSVVMEPEQLAKIRKDAEKIKDNISAELSDAEIDGVIGGATVFSRILNCPYGKTIIENYAGQCPPGCPNLQKVNVFDNSGLHIDTCGGCTLLDEAAAHI
jgi:hypothetical protein